MTRDEFDRLHNEALQHFYTHGEMLEVWKPANEMVDIHKLLFSERIQMDVRLEALDPNAPTVMTPSIHTKFLTIRRRR